MFSGKSSDFDVFKCKKTDSNEYTCRVGDKEGEKTGTVKVRGSKDGDLEPMEMDFEGMSKKERDKVMEEIESQVRVKSNNSSDPYRGRRE